MPARFALRSRATASCASPTPHVPTSTASFWSLAELRDADPLLGVALAMIVAVVAAAALHRWVGLPRPLGAMLVGALAGPVALRLVEPTQFDAWKPLLDLAIGILVFELGTRLRPRWLVDNRWLAAGFLLEGALAGIAVTVALSFLGAPMLSATVAGAVAMSTSPVMTMAMLHELKPRGQVAERVLMASALNSVLAMLAVKAWSVVAATGASSSPLSEFVAVGAGALYVVGGSLVLGAAAGGALHGLSRLSRGTDTLVVLQIALVIVASLLAARWKLSPLLALLAAGVVARTAMGLRLTVEPQLGTAGAVLGVLLFVGLGLLFSIDGLTTSGPWIAAIIVARFAGKALAIALTARFSALGWRQAAALTLALQPMGSLAVLLAADSFDWSAALPGAEPTVLQALLVATTLMQASGPLWMQWALRGVARECGDVKEDGDGAR